LASLQDSAIHYAIVLASSFNSEFCNSVFFFQKRGDSDEKQSMSRWQSKQCGSKEEAPA
jgi:hypothetical protein